MGCRALHAGPFFCRQPVSRQVGCCLTPA